MKQIKIQQQNFVLLSSGAIYWIEKATLMLADPHLGKIAHFRKNGIAVPRKAEGVFYNKVARIADQFEIKKNVNNISIKHRDLMPMNCDILKFEYFSDN